jgi:hypothetical protein
MKIGIDFPNKFAAAERQEKLMGLKEIIEIPVTNNLRNPKNQNEEDWDVWSF